MSTELEPKKDPVAPVVEPKKDTPAPVTATVAKEPAQAVVQPSGNAAVAQDAGLATAPVEGKRQEFSPSIETTAQSTEQAEWERRQAAVDTAVLGVASKDPKTSHEAAKATVAALDGGLANQPAGVKAALVSSSVDQVGQVTAATLKTKDPTKIAEVFTGLSTAAEKAGPQFVQAISAGMIKDLKSGGPGAIPAFEKGLSEAMKSGNTLLAADLAKQLGESKDPAMRALGARITDNVTGNLGAIQGDHATATATAANLEGMFQRSADQMKAAGATPEKIAEARAAFKKEHSAAFEAEEASAKRLGASMQGAAYLKDNPTKGRSYDSTKKQQEAANRHLLLAPTLARTENGSAAIADALAMKGQGHDRTWIDTAQDAGKTFDADAKTKGYSDHLNGALQVGGAYGLAVNAAGNDANGVADVTGGLAAYAKTPEERSALSVLSQDARLAGAEAGLPADQRKSPAKALEGAISRFDAANKRADAAALPNQKEASGRLKNISEAIKGGAALHDLITKGTTDAGGIGDMITGAGKGLELAGGTKDAWSQRNMRGKAAGIASIAGGLFDSIDKGGKIAEGGITGLKGLLETGIGGANLVKDSAELLGKQVLTKGIGKVLPWAGLAMDGMNFLDAANKGDTYGAASAAAPAAGAAIGAGVGAFFGGVGAVPGAAIGYGIGSVVQVGMDVGRALFGATPGSNEVAASERMMLQGIGLDGPALDWAAKNAGGFDDKGNSNMEGVNAIAKQLGMSTADFLKRGSTAPGNPTFFMKDLVRDPKTGQLDPKSVEAVSARIKMMAGFNQ